MDRVIPVVEVTSQLQVFGTILCCKGGINLSDKRSNRSSARVVTSVVSLVEERSYRRSHQDLKATSERRTSLVCKSFNQGVFTLWFADIQFTRL